MCYLGDCNCGRAQGTGRGDQSSRQGRLHPTGGFKASSNSGASTDTRTAIVTFPVLARCQIQQSMSVTRSRLPPPCLLAWGCEIPGFSPIYLTRCTFSVFFPGPSSSSFHLNIVQGPSPQVCCSLLTFSPGDHLQAVALHSTYTVMVLTRVSKMD